MTMEVNVRGILEPKKSLDGKWDIRTKIRGIYALYPSLSKKTIIGNNDRIALIRNKYLL